MITQRLQSRASQSSECTKPYYILVTAPNYHLIQIHHICYKGIILDNFHIESKMKTLGIPPQINGTILLGCNEEGDFISSHLYLLEGNGFVFFHFLPVESILGGNGRRQSHFLPVQVGGNEITFYHFLPVEITSI